MRGSSGSKHTGCHFWATFGAGSGADPNPNLPVVPSETLQRARAGYPEPLECRGFHYAHPQLLHQCPGRAVGRVGAVMATE
jgi:hypothetical protein